jgi:hypothetical protein
MYEQIGAPCVECRIAQQMYEEPLVVAIPFRLWNSELVAPLLAMDR